MVYMILSGQDLPIGVARDTPTLLSLIELARLKGAIGLSLHGTLPCGTQISGEMSLAAAKEIASANPTQLS